MLRHHLQLDLYNKASRYGDTVRVHNSSSCILPKTMSIVRPYLYLLPKEQSRNWTLEHIGPISELEELFRGLTIGQVLVQFFVLSAPTLTNSGVGNDTDPRSCSLSIKLTKVPYTSLTLHLAVLSRPQLPSGLQAPSDIINSRTCCSKLITEI